VAWLVHERTDQSAGRRRGGAPDDQGGGEGHLRRRTTRTDSRFHLSVTVPANTQAEVWVPASDLRDVVASGRAVFQRMDGAYAVYAVPSGTHSFTADH
jgi:hypothetical protein